eukprot:jgi/Tetstr1/454720/TSEL_041606.t1
MAATVGTVLLGARPVGPPPVRRLLSRPPPVAPSAPTLAPRGAMTTPRAQQRPSELSYSHPHGRSGGGSSGERGEAALFDSFWRARGVADGGLRAKLVEAGLEAVGSAPRVGKLGPGDTLQEPTSWLVDAQEGCSQVAAISVRLHELAELLGQGQGFGDLDVSWMVIREPRLLSADLSTMRAMLLWMKVADGCQDVDVAKLCSAQPSLLLQDVSQIDNQESFAQRMKAWQYGLATDSDEEWARRYGELEEYMRVNGDPHVGCREGDDRDLARWARMQRAAFKARELPESRVDSLRALKFEFTVDEAEWQRWFHELSTFYLINGHSSPAPLSSRVDLYLINWCGVQRIARRSRMLSQRRIDQLDSVQFDWTGADPLS